MSDTYRHDVEASDPDECATRCRCADTAGHRWLYLNAFCRNRENHRPHIEYGYPNDPITRGARDYHDDYMREHATTTNTGDTQ